MLQKCQGPTVWKFLISVALSIATSGVHALDYFDKLTPKIWKEGSLVAAGSTLGGYPMFLNGEPWQLLNVTTQTVGGGPEVESVKLGTVAIGLGKPGAHPSAILVTTANLHTVSTNQYIGGTPCGGKHIAVSDKGRRKDDNCLTIDAINLRIDSASPTYLGIRISQSRSAGRVYSLSLLLNPEPLGFANSVLDDWSIESIQSDPKRKAFMEKLLQWAELLQEASYKATDFDRPQDVFLKIPSFKTLMN
jgi:hypothetical protein